jgi:uncharacterized LabA/DUF88 family protein
MLRPGPTQESCVSKNVAVFVDVANIFYAAKAAGVDIDYVTLLKSATAGRDFVRAYAYTGLDPDNDNQLAFHKFLRNSGYKVVSKDIRKYGDGRIKANLDIELVVDMMRIAQHIDIAVVVSGDGDFAPAIRAVQQLGVRVEVISFKGNTSSDLFEVADVFHEIANIARVEKGARSGRRIAADDDLSMTAVPEKETDMGPRRRRGGRRDGRDERPGRGDLAPVADAGLPGNVIVLPGERLSRAPSEEAAADEPLAYDGEASADGDDASGEGRRRRRRRGGRGRGRGRRPEGEAGELGLVGEEPAGDAGPADEDEFLEEELAPLPQHSTFGSVWDTQIGVPPGPVSASADDDEEYDDEPEIPEYLLAERRQQGNRGGRRDRSRQGGRQAGYRAALDRERFGRGASTGSSFGGGMNRAPAGRAGSGQRDQGGRSRDQGGRRPPPQGPRETASAVSSSGSQEPWSEVPPEVQELLRAELARRGSTRQTPPARPDGRRGGRGTAPETAAAAGEPAVVTVDAPAPDAQAPRPTRRRTTKATAEAAEAPVTPEAVTDAPAPRATRRRTTKAPAGAAEAPVTAEAAPDAPAPTTTRRRTTKATAEAAGAGTTAEAPAAEAAAPKATRRRTTKATAQPAEG